MKIANRDVLYNEISRFNPVTLEIAPGETFQVQTELNTGGWLQHAEDVWSPEKQTASNPASGCIAVQGAQPGHMLAVEILDIDLANVGYTASSPSDSLYSPWLRKNEWGVISKTVRIENGFVQWSDNINIPVHPMVGVVATAPAKGVPRNVENGPYGGNMDIQEVTIGNTVYLPVFVERALLHVGDVHAAMGDGEICGAGGIETRGTVTLRVTLHDQPPEMRWPRIETPEEIITVGCARPAEDAFRIALQEMILWMVHGYGFSEPEAFLLLGQILHARCTQFVDPLYTYICKVPKIYLNP
ncbi:acetamidase [candidate division KSB3 bacterium]|uniref:Acetamidase n=1 Tax=candidate division KSB3 bacterium TaxID=2044937 RepID=A0A9D5JVC0_9BACT|nr:acetamidase [candidate division KSB3 bacterium]MBD3324953.1 acetamidase [candidate division KSB3 bacterium]